MSFLVIDPSAIIGVPPGTLLAGQIISDASLYWYNQTIWATAPPNAVIHIPNDDEIAAFKMPDFYNMLPQVVRDMDVNLVDRPDVSLYFWDSVPEWDTAPYHWDEVIGPEPILKTTMRLWQLELEKCRQEIERLTLLFNISRVDPQYVPYLAEMYGVPMPSASEPQQREFLIKLPNIIRTKGTIHSFTELFETLGFDAFIYEQFQRRTDGALIPGPQPQRVTTDIVRNEPVGSTIASAGPYRFNFLKTPVERGTIKLFVFDQSANSATVITDNGYGQWSDGIAGSINYFTGAASITFAGVPLLIGQPIKVDYQFLPDPFPDPRQVWWTDRIRSSVASLTIVPFDVSVPLTQELSDRMMLYLQLLKPAHVILSEFVISLRYTEREDLNMDDSRFPMWVPMTVESEFATVYRGYGWDSIQQNGSRNPDPAFSTIQHRPGGEYMRDPYLDPLEEGPPDVYPVLRDGRFQQPTSASDNEWFWGNQLPFYDSTVSNDSVADERSFSIVQDVPTTLTTGDWIIFNSGQNEGQGRQISGMVDQGTYYDITVGTPETFAAYTGTGAQLIFVGARVLPVRVDPSTTTLTFYMNVAGVPTQFTENDDGVGGFSNGNGYIVSASIDYDTGELDVTFNSAPVLDTLVTLDYDAVFSFVPDVDDEVTLISDTAIGREGLSLRAEDPLEMRIIEDPYTGTGVQLIFAGAFLSRLAIAPLHADLTFTIGGVPTTVTDNGSGAFIHASIASSSLNYVTGAFNITFNGGNAPDNATPVRMAYETFRSTVLGVV